jgi:cell division septation protein DedD
MNPSKPARFLALLAPAVCFWLASCVSSEETGSSGSRAVVPQQTVVPIDTQAIRIRAEATASREKPKPVKNRSGARFQSKQDTVKASLTRKSKQTVRAVVRPENPAYTVQIGAFGNAQNALKMQKAAKERLGKQVVLNNFGPTEKLYRVSVGKFDTKKEANSLRKELLEKFPKYFSGCWVNYISK